MERGEVSVAVADAPTLSTDASTSSTDAPTLSTDAPTLSTDAPSNSSESDVPSTADLRIEVSVDLQADVPEEVDVELIIEDAPALALNIEQEVSLSAPPDLNAPECPSCWKALRATDKFCCWCGEAQPNRVLPFLKLCLECSTFLPEKANYCYSCGTDVGYSSRRKVRVPHELFKDEESEFFPRFDA